MPLFEMHRELKGVEPHLLTQKEYAVLVRAAAKKLIPGFIKQREAARRDLRAWDAANPEPKRPASYASNAEYERYRDKYESHRNAWGHEYQKLYELSNAVQQLKLNIILANVIESGRIESCQAESNFWMYFRGVNNPLLNHGQAVFRALYQHIDVPEHVLAEWPEGVAQVRKEMAARAAWDKANPDYAHL